MQIYEALEKDHDKVMELLRELISLTEANEERRGELIGEIRDELVPHSRAEESVLYNSLRLVEGEKAVVAHSYQEHLQAEALLRTLQMKDKIDADWKQTAQKLKAALEHHIAEEESEVFEAARRVFTDEEAVQMGEAFERLKPEVREEGFMQTTLDMVANMMPPRLSRALGKEHRGVDRS